MFAAMYGGEAANPSEKAIARLTSAILDCMAGTKKPRDLDAILNRYGYNEKDLDPITQIMVRRLIAVRRAIAKRPNNKTTKSKTHRLLQPGGTNRVRVGKHRRRR